LPQARRHRLSEVTGESVGAESVVVIVDRGQDSQALLAMAVAGGHWKHVADVRADGDPIAATGGVGSVGSASSDAAHAVEAGDVSVYTGDAEARSHGHGAGETGELAAAAAAAPDAVRARVLVHVAQNLAGEGGSELPPERLAELVKMEVAGELTATQAKQVLAELVVE